MNVPAPLSPAARVVNDPAGDRLGSLFVGEEALPVKGPERRGQGQRTRGSVDPVLKSWIDNVIVPALLDRWGNENARGAAA